MKQLTEFLERGADRRSFLKNSMVAGAVATVGAGILGNGLGTLAHAAASKAPISDGDIAILRFLAAAELLESDLWEQYAELGGVTTGRRIPTSLPFSDSMATGRSTSPATPLTRSAMRIS